MARVIKTTLSIEGGGASLLLRGTTDDHAYMGFYARSAAPATRSGLLGYGGAGTNHLTLQNEISNGDINLTTAGAVSSINLTATTGGYGYVNVAPNLKITNPYGTPYLMLDAAGTGSENEVVIGLQRRGSKRWEIRKTSQAETGSNVGSNLEIARFNDAGNEIDPIIQFYRDTGNIDVFPNGGGTLGVYGDLLIGYGSNISAGAGPGEHDFGGALINNQFEYVDINHTMYVWDGAQVWGGLDVASGLLTMQGTPVALSNHTHTYLPLSGGTLTGGVKAPAYILDGDGYGGVVECHGGHRGTSTNTDYIILTAPPGWESTNYAVFADITVGLGWAGHVTYRVAAAMNTSEAYGWSSSAGLRKYHVDMAYAQYQAATELHFGEDGSGQPCIIIGPGSHVYASVHAVIRTGYFDPPNLDPWAVSFAADLTGYTTVAGSLAERELRQSALSVHSTLTVVNDTTSANIQLDAADPSADRDALCGTFRRGVVRWQFGKSATAETGSNAGSDFQVYRYSDAGAYLDAPLTVRRSTGDVTMPKTVWLNTAETFGVRYNDTESSIDFLVA